MLLNLDQAFPTEVSAKKSLQKAVLHLFLLSLIIRLQSLVTRYVTHIVLVSRQSRLFPQRCHQRLQLRYVNCHSYLAYHSRT